MEVISQMVRKLHQISPKQILVASVFMFALSTAITLGTLTKQHTSAATTRDCSKNSIDFANVNGGCGALTPMELVKDIWGNQPGDLPAIYNDYGLATSEYDRFVRTAKMGTAYKDGTIKVGNDVVARDAVSVGRNKFSYSRAKAINGKTYWESRSQDVFGASSIPVMVMFDAKGQMEFAVLTACGNPIRGNKVSPSYACNALNKSAVNGQKDTYNFTTSASVANGAVISKVVYNFGDGSAPVTQTSPTTAVKHAYTKPGTFTATVTVFVKLPGGTEVAIPPVKCKTTVTVTPPEKPKEPFYSCVVLTPLALNDKKTQFRFTVTTTQGNGATLKDVDFTLDGTATTTGVVTKDAQGKIFKEYTFTDTNEHTVVAKVNFNVAGGVKSATCQAKVTAEKQPVCPLPGKENLPPDSPECVETPPTPPVTPPTEELPQTGMGNVLGVFAGSSAFAAAGHLVVQKRRARKNAAPVDVSRYLS